MEIFRGLVALRAVDRITDIESLTGINEIDRIDLFTAARHISSKELADEALNIASGDPHKAIRLLRYYLSTNGHPTFQRLGEAYDEAGFKILTDYLDYFI